MPRSLQSSTSEASRSRGEIHEKETANKANGGEKRHEKDTAMENGDEKLTQDTIITTSTTTTTTTTTGPVGLVHALHTRWPFLNLPIHDHIKTLLLLLLAVLTLPLTYVPALLLTHLPPSWLAYLFPLSLTTPSAATTHRATCRAAPNFRERTVLVTGTTMTKGLTLARAFHLCGHRVIAADVASEKSGAVRWRWWKKQQLLHFSRAFDGLYSLKQQQQDKSTTDDTYVQDLCTIVRNEKVDLWVSCSGVTRAVEDGLVREALGSGGRWVQFDAATTARLHDKASFIRCARETGLPVPATYEVGSHGEVFAALQRAVEKHPKRQFILKPIGVDDVHRGAMTLLPREDHGATEAYVRALPISRDRPWILQQFIGGGREYCTHSLVVDGEVKVFVACPSRELLMQYQALPAHDALSMAMLQFTRVFARAQQQRTATSSNSSSSSGGGGCFTGHLSFDFMAEEDEAGRTRLYAIECNPRAHTAVALFSTPGPDLRAMVDAYVSAIDESPKQSPQSRVESSLLVTPPVDVVPRYWIGHELVTKAILPLLHLLRGRQSVGEVWTSFGELRQQIARGSDATLELWDPWPFVGLYHHYWPWAILKAWYRGERWSRLNVSTTKMFAC